MKKVVLLAVNAKYIHSSLSVWVIAGGVSKYARYSHDVCVVEATINQSVVEVVNEVIKYKPEVIGVSSYIWNADMLSELLRLLRMQLPDVIIVLGGPEASNNAGYWLENGANHVLCGEGEYELPRLLDALVEDAPEKHAPDEDVLANDNPINDTPIKDNPIDPYTDVYLDALGGRLAYIETSRGCPFSCAFCLSAGSKVKYFPLDIVKNQILKLSKSNTKTVKFVDRTFNCNPDRAYLIFDYIIGLDTSCTFHFEVAADLFDEKMLKRLESAPPGRIQFEIGLQSFYEPALKASSRQTDIIKAEQNIRALMKMQNIHIHVDLIAGLPYETLLEFKNSFDRAYSLNAHTLQLGFLKLLHGSKLREQADLYKIRYSKKPPYEITGSPWLSAEDIKTLKQAENALQHTYNKGRFLSTLDYVLNITGKRPFSLFNELGIAIPNHGTQLENYAALIYEFFTTLPGIEVNKLKDHMIYDWLSMVKGNNAPEIMKNNDNRRKHVVKEAEKALGHKMRREEYAILSSDKGIFVNRNNRNPVTGLYEVHIFPL
ncbi:MAG: B12-binding domain-containing radical SAM protein [Oscillospiraceae bacterium]|nr:B12-binding domain-containing radical SAM protein [Oscillospiraceae bacterium]